MAKNLFYWVFHQHFPSQAMDQPSQRKLWCAFSDDTDNVFSITCTLEHDTVDDIKEKILEMDRESKAVPRWKVHLYCPARPVKDGLDLEKLHPRRQISLEFSRSHDPNIDVIIIISQAKTQPPKNDGKGNIPHL
jgi:hypothetical protein